MVVKTKVVSLDKERTKRSSCDGHQRAVVIGDALTKLYDTIHGANIMIVSLRFKLIYPCQRLGRHSFKLNWKNPKLAMGQRGEPI